LTLYSNYLDGSIPASLACLPDLELVNLADNNLATAIPAALTKRMDDTNSCVGEDYDPDASIQQRAKKFHFSFGGNSQLLEDSVDRLLQLPRPSSRSGSSSRLDTALQGLDDRTQTTQHQKQQQQLVPVSPNRNNVALHRSSSAPGPGMGSSDSDLVLCKASTQWAEDKGPYTVKEQPQRARKEWTRYSRFKRAAEDRRVRLLQLQQ
jgi:hypothetical protein